MKTFFIALSLSTIFISGTSFAGTDAGQENGKSGWNKFAEEVKENSPLGLGAMGMYGGGNEHPAAMGMYGGGNEHPTAMGMTGNDEAGVDSPASDPAVSEEE